MVVHEGPSVHAQTPGVEGLADLASPVLLTAWIGPRVMGIPVTTVERILRMAELTQLPDAPPGVVGVLNLHGTVLPAVDPRPRLGVPTPPPDPDHHLVLVAARTRYLLWVDRVDRIIFTQPEDFDVVGVASDNPLTPLVVRVDTEVIPVLSPRALDPGLVLQRASGAVRR